jgi:archaemetzincin
MKAIELQPLGDVHPDVLEILSLALHRAFDVPSAIRHGFLPMNQFYDESRGQYNSTEILHYLGNHASLPRRPHGSDDDVRVVGVARHDLFIPILTYVFGEAALGGSVAVVSYHRFRNELYGLPPDKLLMMNRLEKVAIHELGHTLGLVHCSLQYCVMHAASYVEELDLKGSEFCPFCHSAIAKASRPPSLRRVK